jgi:hypothetical protein
VDNAIHRVLNLPEKQVTMEVDPKPACATLIVPFHLTNPAFQFEINRIWKKHEKTA